MHDTVNRRDYLGNSRAFQNSSNTFLDWNGYASCHFMWSWTSSVDFGRRRSHFGTGWQSGYPEMKAKKTDECTTILGGPFRSRLFCPKLPGDSQPMSFQRTWRAWGRTQEIRCRAKAGAHRDRCFDQGRIRRHQPLLSHHFFDRDGDHLISL